MIILIALHDYASIPYSGFPLKAFLFWKLGEQKVITYFLKNEFKNCEKDMLQHIKCCINALNIVWPKS